MRRPFRCSEGPAGEGLHCSPLRSARLRKGPAEKGLASGVLREAGPSASVAAVRNKRHSCELTCGERSFQRTPRNGSHARINWPSPVVAAFSVARPAKTPGARSTGSNPRWAPARLPWEQGGGG